MTPFEFIHTVCKSPNQQGPKCKSAPLSFLGDAQMEKHYHDADHWVKLPKNHIWYAHFEFAKQIANSKRKEGLKCKFAITPKIEGANCKLDLTIVISGQFYPK